MTYLFGSLFPTLAVFIKLHYIIQYYNICMIDKITREKMYIYIHYELSFSPACNNNNNKQQTIRIYYI